MRQTSFKAFSRIKIKEKAQTFNSSFRYIDDVLKNSQFGEYLHLIYQNELKVKNITNIQKSASYLDIHLEIDNGGREKSKTLRQT